MLPASKKTLGRVTFLLVVCIAISIGVYFFTTVGLSQKINSDLTASIISTVKDKFKKSSVDTTPVTIPVTISNATADNTTGVSTTVINPIPSAPIIQASESVNTRSSKNPSLFAPVAIANTIGTIYSTDCSSSDTLGWPIVDSSSDQLFNLGYCPIASTPYPDYITLTSARTVKLICNGSVVATFTGPGTLTANSVNTNGCSAGTNWWNQFSVRVVDSALSINNVLSVHPGATIFTTPTNIGDNLSILGSGFDPANNTVEFDSENSVQPFTSFSFYNISSSNDTGTALTSFTLSPSKNIPYGIYDVYIRLPDGKISNFKSVTIAPFPAPTNLIAKMNTANIGKVDLSWTSTSTMQTGFAIERAVDSVGTTFAEIGRVEANVTTYVDDLSAVKISNINDAYRVRSIFPNEKYSDYSNTAIVSNCVNVSGVGPRKIVFMKGSGFDGDDIDFDRYLGNVKSAIDQGYKIIDPFKGYINQFSFFVDLKSVDEDKLNIFSLDIEDEYTPDYPEDNKIYDATAGTSIKAGSSCGGGDTLYVFFSDNQKTYPGYDIVSFTDGVMSITNVVSIHPDEFSTTNEVTDGNNLANVIIHETGHAIGHLTDEYFKTSTILFTDGFHNCSNNPYVDYRNSINNHLYASYNGGPDGGSGFWSGCSAFNNDSGGLYRPTYSSIMNATPLFLPGFNAISCGYIISGIIGEPVDKSHAQTHWQECMSLKNTVRTITPALNPTPTIKSITNRGGVQTITGSNFTPVGNTVNLSLGSAVYEINNLPSADGKTLKFNIATSGVNIPTGTYSVKVGAFNSDWSAIKSFKYSIPRR